MERRPIINNNVVRVQLPPTVESLIPEYRYKFETAKVPTEADQMYESLLQFIRQNTDLIQSDQNTFTEGFKNSLAVIPLFIDSIYLESQTPFKAP